MPLRRNRNLEWPPWFGWACGTVQGRKKQRKSQPQLMKQCTALDPIDKICEKAAGTFLKSFATWHVVMSGLMEGNYFTCFHLFAYAGESQIMWDAIRPLKWSDSPSSAC